MNQTFFTYASILTFINLLPYFLYAQEGSIQPEGPYSFETSYIGDNVNNLSGGIETGSCYLGLVNIRFNFDTENAGFWRGGTLYINAANTHGAMPSATLLGDMQVASNIEAGNHTFIQELFYRHAIDKLEFTIGLQDLNIEFANSENGALFLNSSFGILPLISGNIPAPIFPLTTLGFTAKWNIGKNSSWLNAVYEGCPTDFESNPYNLKWQFHSGDGILFISEYQINMNQDQLPGTYKLGFYSHNRFINEHLNQTQLNVPVNVTYGFYAYADQKLWERNSKGLGVFIQMGYSPSKAVTNNAYLGMGMNYYGIFSPQGSDILGLAFAHERFTTSLKSETSIELSYQYQIAQNIFIQPDFQFIVNPAGTGETLENAMVAILRFGLSF